MAVSAINEFSFRKYLTALLFCHTIVFISGCGDDGFISNETENKTPQAQDDTGGQQTPTPTPSPPNTPTGPRPVPHTIKLSYKIKEATVVQGGGFYSSQGGVIVTDEDGNAVVDGTVVRLNIIDTVLAEGDFLVNGDGVTAANNTLVDSNPLLGNAANENNLGFDSLYAVRNDAAHFIEAGDHVFLINANEEDKDRIVSATANNSITVAENYTNTYPAAPYDNSEDIWTTRYLVGVSALGAEISGEDADGNLTTGYAVTKDGRATFRVTYPSSVTVLNTGCGNVPYYDTRSIPFGDPGDPDAQPPIPARAGSARVYVVASVNSEVVTVDGEQFCFSPVEGFTVESPEQASGQVGEVIAISALIRDGGDTAPVPYFRYSASIENGEGAAVSILSSSGRADAYGNANVIVLVGGTPGATATVTISAEKASASTTVVVN